MARAVADPAYPDRLSAGPGRVQSAGLALPYRRPATGLLDDLLVVAAPGTPVRVPHPPRWRAASRRRVVRGQSRVVDGHRADAQPAHHEFRRQGRDRALAAGRLAGNTRGHNLS